MTPQPLDSVPIAKEWHVALRIVRPGTLPSWSGSIAHAAWLKTLERVDSSLASTLHEGDDARPYTLSCFSGEGAAADRGRVALDEGSELSVRVVALGETVSRFAQALPRLERQLMLIDRCVGEIVKIAEGVESSVASLLGAPHEGRVTLTFCSPTAVRRPGCGLDLFPSPAAVFGSASRTWQQWIGTPPDLTVEAIRIRGYRLRTAPVFLASGKLTGFVGTVSYETSSDNAQALTALCRWLEMAGCGIKTTQGMGQVRSRLGRPQENVSAREESGSDSDPSSP